jgi:hypothetical protein
MLVELISYPATSKNLFAVVLQKGYCKYDETTNYIQSKNSEVDDIYKKCF